MRMDSTSCGRLWDCRRAQVRPAQESILGGEGWRRAGSLLIAGDGEARTGARDSRCVPCWAGAPAYILPATVLGVTPVGPASSRGRGATDAGRLAVGEGGIRSQELVSEIRNSDTPEECDAFSTGNDGQRRMAVEVQRRSEPGHFSMEIEAAGGFIAALPFGGLVNPRIEEFPPHSRNSRAPRPQDLWLGQCGMARWRGARPLYRLARYTAGTAAHQLLAPGAMFAARALHLGIRADKHARSVRGE